MSDNPLEQHALLFTGPGSQPGEEDGAELEYMEMPKGMSTFSMNHIPEPSDVPDCKEALATLADVLSALKVHDLTKPNAVFDVTELNEDNRALVDQILGEGEVSVVAGGSVQAQESVLAGVWRVRMSDETGKLVADIVEIGAFPEAARKLAENAPGSSVATNKALPEGIINAPALVTELNDEIGKRAVAQIDTPHVINLTLLPHSDVDFAFLEQVLGRGTVTVLSRGYGNCRVQSTGTRGVWWVQYYNSQDALILNTIEVTGIPIVACAAREDIEDSAERLQEILEVYQ